MSDAPLFALGQTVVTPGALQALIRVDRTGELLVSLLARHQAGDWGEIPEEDEIENQRSLAHGWRLLSAYTIAPGVKVYVITEADRSATTLLLPDEY